LRVQTKVPRTALLGCTTCRPHTNASRSLARPFRAHRSRDAGGATRRLALLGFLPLQRMRNHGFVFAPRPFGRDGAEVASLRHVPPSAFRTLPAVSTPHVPCEPVEGSLTLLGFRLQGFPPTREPYPSRGLPALLPFVLSRAPRSARGGAGFRALLTRGVRAVRRPKIARGRCPLDVPTARSRGPRSL